MWPQVGHFDEEFALIDRIAADAPAGVGVGVALARSVTVASSRAETDTAAGPIQGPAVVVLGVCSALRAHGEVMPACAMDR